MNEITIAKRKVGPITERYFNGEFHTVEREKNGRKRMANVDLDNSHHGDYKVAYASDPLLVIQSKDLDHDELQSLLEEKGLWFDTLQSIDLPSHTDMNWRSAYKSLPRDTMELDRLKETVKDSVERDLDYIEEENSITAYL